MMPKQRDMELPLLAALKGLGGKAKPQDIYTAVTKAFPQMTQADLAEQLQSGGSKWTNRIQWVRQRLVATGEMDSPAHGIWGITPKGEARLKGQSAGAPGISQPAPTPSTSSQTAPPPVPPQPVPPNLEETVDDYLTAFTAKVLQKLHDLTPEQFEEFAGALHLDRPSAKKQNASGPSGSGRILDLCSGIFISLVLFNLHG